MSIEEINKILSSCINDLKEITDDDSGRLDRRDINNIVGEVRIDLIECISMLTKHIDEQTSINARAFEAIKMKAREGNFF